MSSFQHYFSCICFVLDVSLGAEGVVRSHTEEAPEWQGFPNTKGGKENIRESGMTQGASWGSGDIALEAAGATSMRNTQLWQGREVTSRPLGPESDGRELLEVTLIMSDKDDEDSRWVGLGKQRTQNFPSGNEQG